MSESQSSKLISFVDARIPIIVVGTGNEDNRFIVAEQQSLESAKMVEAVYQWDVTGKLIDRMSGQETTIQSLRDVIAWFSEPDKYPKPPPGTEAAENHVPVTEPQDLRQRGPKNRSVLFAFDALFHLQDPSRTGHSNPTITRVLKTIAPDLISNKRNVVLIGGKAVVPPELVGIASYLDYPRPDLNYMRKTVEMARQWFATPDKRADPKSWLQLTETEAMEIAMLLRGFRAMEAENVLARALRRNAAKRIADPSIPMGFDMDLIREAKIETIQASGALEIVLPKKPEGEYAGLKKIGGAGNLKAWWETRRMLFSEEARHEGIDIPRGGVIFGPGGTGKDNAVEAIAEATGWTTLYADIGAMKAPLQGQTHANFRDILASAEAQAPCFLVISEFEKMFAGGMSGSAAFDGGTSSEIYATFLNWMQRRTSSVFVWGLTNDIYQIPMPALRAGRFDEIFFMDMPEVWEREEIFDVHLRRSGWDPVELKLDLGVLADKTDGFTGAEIRKAINESMIAKFVHEGPRPKVQLTMAHLTGFIGKMSPISKTYGEDLKKLREFAENGKFPRANSVEKNQKIEPGAKKKVGATVRKSL